jgi:adenine C2-methylase RlmN of 23S rRNA A2503 and tRNA A37
VLYLHDPDALGDLLPGEPSFRADQLREWLYEHPVPSTKEMTNLPAALREQLAGGLWPFTVDVEQTPLTNVVFMGMGEPLCAWTTTGVERSDLGVKVVLDELFTGWGW